MVHAAGMADDDIHAHIEQLVAEEHELQHRQEGAPSPETHERLRVVEVELDRYWDLLRRRKARREFGQDDADVTLRDAGTVEGYEG
jgi:Protein of unknown function (DUF2630)